MTWVFEEKLIDGMDNISIITLLSYTKMLAPIWGDCWLLDYYMIINYGYA